VTIATSPLRQATRATPRPFPRAASVIGDVLSGLAVVLSVPFVILAIGLPIALCLRLLLWMIGML